MAESDWVMLVLAILFVVTAAFLVAAETAIGRVSRSRVEEMARDKPGKATERLRVIVEDRARYVNVMLFLHTAFAVAATALVTYLCVEAGPWGPLVGLFVALLIMTGVMFIALGVAPRTLGRQHADRIALRWGKFARGAAAVLGPFVSLLILIGNALTPGKGYREGPFASQAELARAGRPGRGRPGHRGRRGRDAALGVRARRHDRARGHGAAHGDGLDRAAQDPAPGDVPGAAIGLLPHPGHRREP